MANDHDLTMEEAINRNKPLAEILFARFKEKIPILEARKLAVNAKSTQSSPANRNDASCRLKY